MRYCFGEKIRTVRERRGLTLREVADRAGVSESLVSQIERNRVSPALDTLLSLSDALDLDLEYLFADYRRERAVRITRREERPVLTKPGVLYERLALEGQGRDGIEAYYVSLEPGARTKNTEYGHPGVEMGIVREGQAELTVGNRTYRLSEGDSVSFLADSPHVMANAGPEVLKLLWVISPPKGEFGT